jgi:hypothetical protein
MKLLAVIWTTLALGWVPVVAQSTGAGTTDSAPAVFAAGAMVHAEGVFSTDLIQGVPALPRVRVATAPAVGAWSLLARTSVVETLRLSGVDLSGVRWTGADAARISRAMRLGRNRGP